MNVFERDWDVLIILDALRIDLVAEVHEAYPYLSTETVSSVGRTSMQWMERTFTEEHRGKTEQTAYVTANPHTENHLDPDRLAHVDEVWRYAWDDELGTTPAKPVTERAVAAHRNRDADRLIVHYMQPHYPFVPAPFTSGLRRANVRDGQNFLDELWDRMRSGELAREEVWKRYRQNLEYVLEHVETLLRNVTGDVVITADHGTAYGELGLYGHNEDNPLRVVNEVPWCRTSATDEQTIDPPVEPDRDVASDTSVQERLQDLGYT